MPHQGERTEEIREHQRESNEYFVDKQSIVRKIWGSSDTILFIFAGAAAEFALNKAVDWLYFTGRLPADPVGRLFSTVSYAKAIVFSKRREALMAIDAMASIHSNVEAKRGSKIPDWAYRDVLFMLIDYSIRSFELLERKMATREQEDVFEVFNEVGTQMGIRGLPHSFDDWKSMRIEHLSEDLNHSHYSDDLFKQYRKHLGSARYLILREAQLSVVPDQVNKLLPFGGRRSMLPPLLIAYKISRILRLNNLLKALILPSKYKKEINQLETSTV